MARRQDRRPRILMLGWEYPPRYVGGLGKASQGIARGVAALGMDVLFVLPQFHAEARGNEHLDVTGADDWLATHAARGRRALRTPTWLPLAGLRLDPYGGWPRAGGSVAVTTAAVPGPLPPARLQHSIYGGSLADSVARFRAQALALARRARFDLVHAHDWMTFPAALALARAQHIPLFLHLHSTEFDRSGCGANPRIVAIERETCRAATHVFAVSDYTRQIILEHYGVDADKVSVAYNAPDPAALAPPNAGARHPWIVFLGRLAFQKGPDHFLAAARIAAGMAPEARFIVCGAGGMLEQLKAQAARAGIAERVEFRGFLTPSEVNHVLGQAALLVMPSVSEPFGLVALEALRMGTPVILSRQSGVREVIGRSLQADFWDHEKLADQMLAVLHFPALATQLVEEGQGQLRQLSWHVTALHIAQAYAAAGVGHVIEGEA